MAAPTPYTQAVDSARATLLSNSYTKHPADPNLYLKTGTTQAIRIPIDMSGHAHKVNIVNGAETLLATIALTGDGTGSPLANVL